MHGDRRCWSVGGLLAVSGLGVLLSGCGSGATTQIGPTSALLAPGYLATSGQEVDFIQWTRQGNSFSGSFNAVYITGSPPSANTQPKQGTASGSIDGFNTAKGGPGSGGGIFNGTRGTVTLLASLVVANTPDNCFGC